MDKQEIILNLRNLISVYLNSLGIELVELIYRYEGRDLFLRVLVDIPCGGISVDECARLNRGISDLLDQQDFLGQGYILEVSSPGLDRPLITLNDFARCKNKKAKFFLREMINGKLEWDGVITKVENDTVSIDINGDILELPVSKINKAKQLF